MTLRPYRWGVSESLQMRRPITNESTQRPFNWVDHETLQMIELCNHTNELTLKPYKWVDSETLQMGWLWDLTNESKIVRFACKGTLIITLWTANPRVIVLLRYVLRKVWKHVNFICFHSFYSSRLSLESRAWPLKTIMIHSTTG